MTPDPELREPDLPRTAKVRKKALRTGWTTGTCASAAAKAATTALDTGQIQHAVEVALPDGQRVSFPVDECTLSENQAQAVVVKYSGKSRDWRVTEVVAPQGPLFRWGLIPAPATRRARSVLDL